MSYGNMLADAFAGALVAAFAVGVVVGAVGIEIVLWLWRHVGVSFSFQW